MRTRAFEKATRGALAAACAALAGCVPGRITIVNPPNGGFTDPTGNMTARVAIAGGTAACGTSFQATLDGVDVTQRFSPLPPASANPQASFLGLVPGEHLLKVSVVAGSACTLVSDSATFAYVGPGAIYVTDGSFTSAQNDRIVEMTDMTGANWTTFGSSGNGANQFSFPRGIFVYSIQKIYAVDQSNSRIARFEGMGGAGWTAFGTFGYGVHQFYQPFGIFLDPGMRTYVTDVGRNRLVRFDDMAGGNWTEIGSTGAGIGQFNQPAGVAIGPSGKIYVVDSGNSRIVRMDDMTGAGWTTFGTHGGGANQFDSAGWIALDASERIYVTDTGSCLIARFDDMTGANWITLGSQGAGTSQFECLSRQMGGVFVDTAGRILVADSGNARIVRMDDMTGAGWTALGTFGSGANQFLIPNGVFVKPPSLVVVPH
jgi:hypothetical protein